MEVIDTCALLTNQHRSVIYHWLSNCGIACTGGLYGKCLFFQTIRNFQNKKILLHVIYLGVLIVARALHVVIATTPLFTHSPTH